MNFGNLLFKNGDTVRSDCGTARATFRPDWNESQPWVTYINGTAGRHFPSALTALNALEAKGFTFHLWGRP